MFSVNMKIQEITQKLMKHFEEGNLACPLKLAGVDIHLELSLGAMTMAIASGNIIWRRKKKQFIRMIGGKQLIKQKKSRNLLNAFPAMYLPKKVD